MLEPSTVKPVRNSSYCDHLLCAPPACIHIQVCLKYAWMDPNHAVLVGLMLGFEVNIEQVQALRAAAGRG